MNRRVVVALLLAAAVGAVSTLAAVDLRLWFALVGVILVPIMAVVVAVSPAAAAGGVAFSQIFDAFELDSPLGTISMGSIVLLAFLVFRWRAIVSLLASSPRLRLLLLIMGVFVAAHVVQVLHEGVAVGARNMITLASFVVFWLVGVCAGPSAAGRRALALGGLAALLCLGGIGILVSFEMVPPPTRVFEPRSFLGFVSPIKRNYGLEVDFVSTGLLLAICGPWLVVTAVRGATLAARVGAAAGYAGVAFMTLFVFQSRSMILEVGMIPVLTLLLLPVPIGVRLAAGGAIAAVALSVIPGILGADAISSSNRQDSYTFVLNHLREQPRTLLLGTDVAAILAEIHATSRYGELDRPDTPVHNMFLGEMLRAGIVAVGSLLLLFAIPLRAGWRLLRSRDRDIGIIICTSIVTGLFEVMINPVEANVAGLWLMLGSVAGMAFALVGRPAEAAPQPAISAGPPAIRATSNPRSIGVMP